MCVAYTIYFLCLFWCLGFAQIQELEVKQAALLEMKTNAEEQLKEAESKVCRTTHKDLVFSNVVSINSRVLIYRSNQRHKSIKLPTRQAVDVRNLSMG